MITRLTRIVAGLGVACLTLAACGGGGSTGGEAQTPAADPAEVSGAITVLTNRTDLDQDGTLKKYAAAFNQTYPKVTVTFQSITDYAGEVKTRMNTDNYGDVLLIPPSIAKTDYGSFFEPLGDAQTLGEKYNWVSFGTTDGTAEGPVYGLGQFGTANGFVYNKKVWQQAGVTAPPTTPAELITALQAVDDKTEAIPYYTNYKDGWPVQTWAGAIGSSTCDPNANTALATDPEPFAAGKGPEVIYRLLFDLSSNKLIEPDPTTTNWENSKSLLATGKVSSMWLGSWALTQMQDAATKAGADPADIGFAPFPVQKDGKFCPVAGPDYLQAININSKNKPAARAWLDWFTDKSTYAADSGALSTLKGAPSPETLADYDALGVSYIELNQDKAGTVSQIDNTSEIGFFSSGITGQRLIDVGRGAAKGSLDEVLTDLNKRWADGIDQVG